MDPVTHLMTGAVLARTGLNRRAAYATLTMVLAAEMPDLDTLWSIAGPVQGFAHHRGWTHTFIGIPFEAAAVTGLVYLAHRWRSGRAEVPNRSRPGAPVSWPLLWLFALIALASHLFLDWTNNYGLRPFFPWNPRWYSGSFVFIFEPVLFVILAAALILPSLFGLVNAEITSNSAADARKPRGRILAIAALALCSAVWIWRYAEHEQALTIAAAADYGAADPITGAQQIRRISISPYPIDPFHWHAVVETPEFYQLAEIDTRTGTISSTADPESDPSFHLDLKDRLHKPPVTLATLAADRTFLGETYLDWSAAPLVEEAPGTDPGAPTVVRFTDLRFAYDTFLLKSRRRPPLSFEVELDRNRHVLSAGSAE